MNLGARCKLLQQIKTNIIILPQETLKYSNIVGSSNVIDLRIQKWLFKQKINANLFFRNVFNQKKRYHSIGASFDLTLYFYITYYPFKYY